LVGTADTIYIALDTNVLYRWDTGLTSYVELSPNIINSLVFNDANGFDGTIALVGSVATLTITTALTTGSVGFIGASGALLQDNANFFWDDTNNRLGIGTNAPTTAIDTFGSGIITRVNGTSTNNAFIGFASAGTNKWSVGNVQSDHRFRIYNEATTNELVSLLETGEFGIGIANPTTKLHIDGGASALIANLDANVSVAKSISFRSDNSNRINIEVSGTESGSNAGANFFLRTYTDAGSLLETPFSIVRSTGVTTLKSLTLTNALSIANGGTGSITQNFVDLTTTQSIGGAKTFTSALAGISATFSDTITSTGNAATSTAHIFNNTTGSSGTAQYYADFKAGATLIGRILRGNAASGYEANGLNIDNFAGMQIKLNALGGSSGAFTVLGGDVGIGTSSIYYASGGRRTVEINGTDNSFLAFKTGDVAKSYLFQTGANFIITNLAAAGGYLALENNGGERMRIASNGFVGVGTTNPLDKFVVQGNSNIWTGNFIGTNTTNSSFGLQVLAGSSGNDTSFRCVNGAQTTEYFKIRGDGYIFSTPTYNNTFASSANVYVNTDGSFGRATSSIRFKTDIEDLKIDTTSILSQMRPIWYRSLSENDKKDWSWYGFIAEELAEIEPRLVHWAYPSEDYIFNKETNKTILKEGAKLRPDGVQYERITVFLVAELQKMRKELDTLKSK
jgi:hypothetical protein